MSLIVEGVGFPQLNKTHVAQPGGVDKLSENDTLRELIPQVVYRINTYLKSQNGKQPPMLTTSPGSDSPVDETKVSISSAAPAYLCGATNGPQGPVGQGCPLTPPFPIPTDASCSSSPGRWPITLPELPSNLQLMTGEGVTVFVLDALPQREQITNAAEAAGDNNLLLQDVDKNVTFSYPKIPDELDLPGPQQVGTGKDVYGRVVGFNMPDHGLFIAGIIRDLAPGTKVECIRVLNDLCIGSVQTWTDALNGIHNRMLEGDLYNKDEQKAKPVVINMSLVIPDDNEVKKAVKKAGVDPDKFDLDKTREGLLTAIQALVDLGAIFVASAGNEGDLRYNPMNMPETRPVALYPAAFAYHGLSPSNKMIPVGAVDNSGVATQYSCYPGLYGVAPYGGDVPKDDNLVIDSNGMTEVINPDAVIGIYSSPSYPARSIGDPQSKYPAPDANGWAYWVGTSFATPIVSAVTARALELYQKRPAEALPPQPQPIIMPAATRTTQWTNLSSSVTTTNPGPVIWAVQCQPDITGEEDLEEVVIVTEVDVTYEE